MYVLCAMCDVWYMCMIYDVWCMVHKRACRYWLTTSRYAWIRSTFCVLLHSTFGRIIASELNVRERVTRTGDVVLIRLIGWMYWRLFGGIQLNYIQFNPINQVYNAWEYTCMYICTSTEWNAYMHAHIIHTCAYIHTDVSARMIEKIQLTSLFVNAASIFGSVNPAE